jgi:hypothetical protein
MKNFTLWIISTLIVWWGIIIASDIVEGSVYWFFKILGIIILIAIPLFIAMPIVKMFDWTNKLFEFPDSITTLITWGILIFLYIILWVIYYFNSDNIDIQERTMAKSVSNHVYFEKWKIPVIEIWEVNNH